jgi:tetratricopeptide (TPR) repeat protein
MDNRDGPDSGTVDDHAYFINVLMLDRNGNRINRRNPQDIYVPFYDHQIPPGAAAVMHYQLKVPEKSDVVWPMTLKARVRYRKFDYEYMQVVHTTFKLTTESLQHLKVDGVPADLVEKLAALAGKEFDTKQKFLDAVRKHWPAKDAEAHEASLVERARRSGNVPQLPIVDLCNDEITLGPDAVEGGKPSPIKPGWQRWNDYGIGCLLENCWDEPSRCGELEMAELAFKKVYEIGQKPEVDKLVQSHGLLNLVRVYDEIASKESLAEALKLLEEWRQKFENDPNAPWWTASWLRGRVNFRLGNLDNLNNAIEDLERVLDPANRNPVKHYDFTQDYLLINLLGEVLRKKGEHPQVDSAERVKVFQHAIEVYENALKLDPENVITHHGLKECFTKFSESMSPAEDVTEEVTEARLQARAKAMADTKRAVSERVDDARVLARMLLEYGQREPKRDTPKLPTLQIVHDTVRPLWGHEESREMSAAVALVLAGVHREMHAIYKVDDNARGRVFPLYRDKHAWADAASTVYELHRDGAPGWTRP